MAESTDASNGNHMIFVNFFVTIFAPFKFLKFNFVSRLFKKKFWIWRVNLINENGDYVSVNEPKPTH